MTRSIRLFVAWLAGVTFAGLAAGQYAPIVDSIDLNAEEVQARIAALNPPDKDISSNLVALGDDRRAVDAEISALRLRIQRSSDVDKELEAIQRAREAILGGITAVSKADCRKLDAGRFTAFFPIRDNIVLLQRRATYAQATSEEVDPFAQAPWTDENKVPDTVLCAKWKGFVGDAKVQARLIGFVDKMHARAGDAQKRYVAARAQAVTLLDLLQKRKEAIDQRITAQSTKSELSSKLWIVIGGIGLFSIATILAVKLFPQDIQVEWVASGQVIQFVTVMIILSVILALGLAEILKENTLGTLLGGIAGYVLAQGVGRAAAREARRDQSRQRQESPPNELADG